MSLKAVTTGVLLFSLALSLADARWRRFAEEPKEEADDSTAVPDTENRKGLSSDDEALLKQLFGGGVGGKSPAPGQGSGPYGDPCHVPPPPLGGPGPGPRPGGPGQPYPQTLPGRPSQPHPQTVPTGPNQPYPQGVPGGPGNPVYPSSPTGGLPVDPLGPYPSLGGGNNKPGPGGPGTYGPPQPLPPVGGPGNFPDAGGYGPPSPGGPPKQPYVEDKPPYKGTDIPLPNDQCAHPYDCVPFYLCQEGNIVDNGDGIIDVRGLYGGGGDEQKLIGGNCPNFLDVCCKKPLDPNEVVATEAPPFQSQCGRRNQEGLAVRIAFQNQSYVAETQFGEFPWMAAVLKTELSPPDSKGRREEYDVYQCGGSLIHPQVIMTAAHCVDKYKADNSALKVRLGEWDTQREEYEPYPHEDRRVTKVIMHDKYVKSTLFNDVALLILDQPASMYHHIDTICLPYYGSKFEGSQCIVTGWGKNNFGKAGSYQEVLKKVDVPVVSNYDCQHALRGTKLGKYFRLHPSFLCAGGEPDKDACQGDGGSPLVCYDRYRDAYVQVGIVAWGIGCGQGGVPGVYADVVQQVDWINDVIKEYFAMDKPYFDLRKAEERIADGLQGQEGEGATKV